MRRSGLASYDDAVTERTRVVGLLDLAGTDITRRYEISALLYGWDSGKPLPDAAVITACFQPQAPAVAGTYMRDYLPAWLGKRRKLAPKTVRSYSDHITKYLVPYLGDTTVQDLGDDDVEDMFTALLQRNADIAAARASGDSDVRKSVCGVRLLAPASMQRLRATLRKALNDAIKARLRTTNPAATIELASGKSPKARVWTDKAIEAWRNGGDRPSPVMVWQPREAGTFLDYAEAHDLVLYALFALVMYRGLRRGEACGLRDQDVDLDAGTITIVQQTTTVGYTPITVDVKSDAGDRIIAIGPTVIAILRTYLEMRGRWRAVSGDAWPDTGLFFVRPDGQPWHPQTVSSRFEQLVADSGLPPVRLHDLRHCAATYLRHGGADMKEVQETLGHATQSITSDIYTSVVLELKTSHADAAADLVPRNRPRAA
jgi:integrase